MLLMIDNYDSFTYNIVQYFGELGEDVRTHRNDEITIDEIKALNPERICLSPGPSNPQNAGITLDVLREFAGKTPILGVCLGHQALGQAFGGEADADTGETARPDRHRQQRQVAAIDLGFGKHRGDGRKKACALVAAALAANRQARVIV